MDIVFMGTPDFSVPSLKNLAEDNRIEIKGVVTQPDRKRGRGQQRQASPVKKTALSYDLRVLQSANVNQKEFVERLEELAPEAIVVVAFGQKLSPSILELPEYGCINLHASLLPKYRGASPIHKAIIEGEEKTGVTTMYMDEGWDTGDIIYKQEVDIDPEETVGSLHDRLARIGSELLLKTLIDIEKGTAPRLPQNEDQATYAYKMEKSDGEIDWNQSARDIYNHIRGVNPWPGAFTYIDGELLKVWQAEVVDESAVKAEPGTVLVAAEDEGLVVATGSGRIGITRLQLAGRQQMPTPQFLRGYDIKPGQKLGRGSDG